jgi:hypothetical protein
VWEVHTWCWLGALADELGRPVTLADVPEGAWDALARPGVDAVWLMGVWERSPTGRALAAVLFGGRYPAADVVGSAYAVRRYVPDARLGGAEGLAAARAALARRGVRLVVDLVPNHVALDHPWVDEHPDWFVHTDDGAIARGRDPYFPPWEDVAQLNVFHPGLRAALAATLEDLAEVADGVRCDMAMLLLSDVVVRTWGERAGAVPAVEPWREVLAPVRASHPGFAVVAEAYWGREGDLRHLGVDACYDKSLYDAFVHGDVDAVRARVGDIADDPTGGVRFVENHDEPRLAATLGAAGAWRSALVATATLPGWLLLHEGEQAARRERTPVQLARYLAEPPPGDGGVDAVAVAAVHDRLLGALAGGLRRGTWTVREVTGWPDDDSWRRLVAWTWEGDDRYLVVVNLGDGPAHGRVVVPGWPGPLALDDLLHDARYDRDGDELGTTGMYVGLDGHDAHLFRIAGAAPA